MGSDLNEVEFAFEQSGGYTGEFYHVKRGAQVFDMHPGMKDGFIGFNRWHWATFKKPCTITEARGGAHSKNSDHYQGRALDIRTWHWPMSATKRQILVAQIKSILGPEWFVLLEMTHLHLSYRGEGYVHMKYSRIHMTGA